MRRRPRNKPNAPPKWLSARTRISTSISSGKLRRNSGKRTREASKNNSKLCAKPAKVWNARWKTSIAKLSGLSAIRKERNECKKRRNECKKRRNVGANCRKRNRRKKPPVLQRLRRTDP